MRVVTGRSAPMTRRALLQSAGAAVMASPWAAWAVEEEKRAGERLIYHTRSPNNAEPALEELVADWLTPTELFYIRSHAPIPEIDAAAYRLSIEGLVQRPVKLTLAELEEMAEADVVATMTCAGNRRSEHSQTRQVDGVPWGAGAIGNARWGGVKLATLLKRAGVKENARHVWFEGLDEIQRGGGTIPFGGSIPLEKALAEDDEVPGALVATRMNGRPLTGDHGYPARAVVPGYIGARSVKWLGRVVVSDRPSPNHYLQGAYKIVGEDDDLTWAEAGPIYRYPINSAICVPPAGATIATGKGVVSGYALPDGDPESTISRVEVSADGGRTWAGAKLLGPERPFCWRLWTVELPLEAASRQITVRAFDSRGHRQPRQVPWNLKGYLYNAWHQIPVRVKA